MRFSVLITLFGIVFAAKKPIQVGVGVVTNLKSHKEGVPSITKHHRGNEEVAIEEDEHTATYDGFPQSSLHYRVSLTDKPQYTYYYVSYGVHDVNFTSTLTHCRTLRHRNEVDHLQEIHESEDITDPLILHFMSDYRCGGYYHFCCPPPQDQECCDHLQRSLSSSKHEWHNSNNHSYKGPRKTGKIVYITPHSSGISLTATTNRCIAAVLLSFKLFF